MNPIAPPQLPSIAAQPLTSGVGGSQAARTSTVRSLTSTRRGSIVGIVAPAGVSWRTSLLFGIGARAADADVSQWRLGIDPVPTRMWMAEYERARIDPVEAAD